MKIETVGGIALNKWCKEIGVSRTTGYVWRKRGWIQCVFMNGKPFLTQQAIANFWARAKANEFRVLDNVPQEAHVGWSSGTTRH